MRTEGTGAGQSAKHASRERWLSSLPFWATLALMCWTVSGWAGEPAGTETPLPAHPPNVTSGTPFDLNCGRDGVLAGVSGRGDWWMDQLTARCVRVNNDGTWSGGIFTRGPTGGTGGKAFTRDCPQNFAATQIAGTTGWYVDVLRLGCRRLRVDGTTDPNTFQQLTAINDGGDVPFGPDQCPGNKPARALRGRSGSYIDQLRLVCHAAGGPPAGPAVQILIPPQLQSPADNAQANNLRPTFTWNAATGATSYRICATREAPTGQNPTPCDAIPETATTATSFTPTTDLPFQGRRIFWAVRGCNFLDQCGTWSTARWLRPPAAPPPPPPAAVLFGDQLYPKFQNARCLNCHHFNGPGGLGSQRVRLSGGQLSDGAHSTLMNGNCTLSCHTEAVTGIPATAPAQQQWHAPATTMDWFGLNAQQTCNLIKTVDNARFGTAAAMLGHLRLDPNNTAVGDRLVRWAISTRRVPYASTAQLGGVQLPDGPGTLAEWNTQVEAWINGGMLCTR